MDYDLDPDQSRRMADLRAAIGEPDPRERTIADVVDPAVEAVVAGADLVGPGLLDRVLLVEEAARLGGPLHATGALLIRPSIRESLPDGTLAVRIPSTGRSIRFAESATGLVELGPQTVRYAAVVPDSFRADPSGTVHGFGEVSTTDEGEEVGWALDLAAPHVYLLGRAAEAVGAACAGLQLVANRLDQRRQFGRPLASFQGLRHRMAELAVDIESSSTLVRAAADRADPASVAIALAYVAETLIPGVIELHQLYGASGFMFETGLPSWTMTMMATRAELSDADVEMVDAADAVWKEACDG